MLPSGLKRSDILKESTKAARPGSPSRQHQGRTRLTTSTPQKRFGAKRHMNWAGEYIIDDAGQCRWHEGLRIQDEQMKSAYRKNSLIEFIIETSAVMGVKVGIA
jgi:hypothetical protein